MRWIQVRLVCTLNSVVSYKQEHFTHNLKSQYQAFRNVLKALCIVRAFEFKGFSIFYSILFFCKCTILLFHEHKHANNELSAIRLNEIILLVHLYQITVF